MKDQLDDDDTKYFERRSVLKHCWFSDAKVQREVKLTMRSLETSYHLRRSHQEIPTVKDFCAMPEFLCLSWTLQTSSTTFAKQSRKQETDLFDPPLKIAGDHQENQRIIILEIKTQPCRVILQEIKTRRRTQALKHQD